MTKEQITQEELIKNLNNIIKTQEKVIKVYREADNRDRAVNEALLKSNHAIMETLNKLHERYEIN